LRSASVLRISSRMRMNASIEDLNLFEVCNCKRSSKRKSALEV